MEGQKTNKLIIVTGSNKGIGRATVESLIERNTEFWIILTARKLSDGELAVKEIESARPNQQLKLTSLQLDLLSDDSIDKFIGSVFS